MDGGDKVLRIQICQQTVLLKARVNSWDSQPERKLEASFRRIRMCAKCIFLSICVFVFVLWSECVQWQWRWLQIIKTMVISDLLNECTSLCYTWLIVCAVGRCFMIIGKWLFTTLTILLIIDDITTHTLFWWRWWGLYFSIIGKLPIIGILPLSDVIFLLMIMFLNNWKIAVLWC